MNTEEVAQEIVELIDDEWPDQYRIPDDVDEMAKKVRAILDRFIFQFGEEE
jgi:hypothetical protein